MENKHKARESELVQRIMAMGFWEVNTFINSVDGVYCVQVNIPVQNGTEGSRKHVTYGVINHNYNTAVEMVLTAIQANRMTPYTGK